MSTVPKAGDPPPANNAKTLTLQSDPNIYVRPTAGTNVTGGQGSNLGPGATGSDAPAGAIPNNPIYGGTNNAGPQGSLSTAENDPAYMMVQKGADPSTGGTQVGPNMGHGATIVYAQNDDTGAKDESGNYPGTVGPSSGPGLGQS